MWNQDYCVPRFRKASRDGDILIVFNKPIEHIELSEGLSAAIVNSGSIQLQLISSGGFDVSEQVDLGFKWAIKSIKAYEIAISVEFNQPDLISSATQTPDRLRVLFVATNSFLRCKKNTFGKKGEVVSAEVILERLRET